MNFFPTEPRESRARTTARRGVARERVDAATRSTSPRVRSYWTCVRPISHGRGVDPAHGDARRGARRERARAVERADAGRRAMERASDRARRARAVAHGWELASALTVTQSDRVRALGGRARVGGSEETREMDDSTRAVDETRAEGGGVKTPATTSGTGDGRPTSARAFYAWYAERVREVELKRIERRESRAEALRGEIALRDDAETKISEIERELTRMATTQIELKTLSRRTQEESERLIAEKERLQEFAEALRGKLDYFDRLERVAEKFQAGVIISGASSDPDGASTMAPREQVLPTLERLDECLDFVSAHPQYAQGGSYGAKFRELQNRAMSTVREYYVNALRKATKHVQDAANGRNRASGATGESEYDEIVVEEGDETALLYVRFRAGASELRDLTEELEKRERHEEYAALLSDCHVLYCEQRAALVAGSVRKKMRAIASAERGKDVLALTRIGVAHLVEVCQAEYGLFKYFFPNTDPNGALAALMIPLNTHLSDILRPRYITITNLEPLAELVEALKGEIIEGIMKTENALALESGLRRITSDVQERLIFRAQTYVKDRVGNYRATAEDLDFPAKLVRARQAKVEDEVDEDDISNWYPPLERTLTCLAKLYRCVDVKTFSGLAHEAVSMCADNIAGAARSVALKSSAVDGQLFLIKHLIILREQIAPFDADFAVSIKDLDFTHMRGHMRRMLSGEMSFFSLTPNNAFYQLASEGRPRVIESKIDSKKELEKQLSAACEAYIMTITKQLVDPMLSFITKVTAFRVSAASQGKSLKDAAFASEDKICAVISQVRIALAESLPKVAFTTKLYLNAQGTRDALLKPIKSNVAEAFAQIVVILDSDFPHGTAERVGVLDPSQLAAVMDEAET